MNRYPVVIVFVAILTGIILFLVSPQPTTGQDNPKLVKAKDSSGIIGYKNIPILPRFVTWCGTLGTTTLASRAIPPY